MKCQGDSELETPTWHPIDGGLTLSNNVDDLVTADSLEHEEGAEALVQLRLAGSVQKRSAERRHLLGRDLDGHF
jgi:hypothetical protein